MENLVFFKQQAKKILKNYKTKALNQSGQSSSDIDSFIYNIEMYKDDSFTLMKAQHIVAKLAGFNKWNDLIKASDELLEIGKYLVINHDLNILEEWKNYEKENLLGLDDVTKLDVFKKVFINKKTNKKTHNEYVLNTSEDENAQDMIAKLARDKKVSLIEAITSSITEENLIKIIDAGFASFALPLWGHADPYSDKDKLDNPVIKFRLNKSKEKLVNFIMKAEDTSFDEAVLYFVLFELENLGYHI